MTIPAARPASAPDDPIRCHPTTGRLDVILEDDLFQGQVGIPPKSTIHIMPGTYLVDGGIKMREGWKLRGAGIGNTIVKHLPIQQGVPEEDRNKMTVIGKLTGWIATDGAEVSDMTVDCNLQNSIPEGVVSAVGLTGNNVRISRVHAINWGSTWQGFESFPLCISAHANNGARFNGVIEDCVVDTPAPVQHADGTTAICIDNGSPELLPQNLAPGGEITGCHVSNVSAGAGGTGSPTYFHAYSGGPALAYIHDNRAINLPGGAAFYQDTNGGGGHDHRRQRL